MIGYITSLPIEVLYYFTTIFKLKAANHFSITIHLLSNTIWIFFYFCLSLI